MFRKKRNDESGIILITVVILSIVMMIVTIGVISTNYSQAIYSRHQIDRIKAEELAKGAAWFNYINRANTGATALPADEIIDGKTYTYNMVTTSPAPGLQVDSHAIRVNY